MNTILDPVALASWAGGVWDPAPPANVAGVSNDTRTLPAGALYVALRGPNFDGHTFVSAAFSRGACGAVVEATFRSRDPGLGPVLRVPDVNIALRAMARGHRRRVDPEVVAVTGSAGKSTVKEMIAQCLGGTMPTACTRGNWNNEIGLPLSMLCLQPGCRAGVFELGTNHPGEIRALAAILEPDWGVVTNIGPAHIENFGTLEAIAREKADLLRSLPRDGLAVLDRDGACFDLLQAAAHGSVLTVSLTHPADYVCLRRRPSDCEFEVAERRSGEHALVKVNQPGEHTVTNALMAISVARSQGVGWDSILAALASFAPLPMRWQCSETGGLLIINDAYNANPLSMSAALRSFEETTIRGDRWLVLADMLELGEAAESEHRKLGALVALGPWRGLVTVGRLGKVIAEAACEAGFKQDRIFACVSNREAAGRVTQETRPGDGVLFKGSRGMHLEEIVQHVAGVRG